uniref:DUF4355 domain-containing protein n=1 Tax=viral metagenome TaxID=1070528 RepID=A0A6M3KXY1_9ZZZZ
MADPQVLETPVRAAPDEAKEPTVKDLIAQIEAIKAAQGGSDRKVKELTSELTKAHEEKEQIAKERMTEKEKATYELERREKALAAKDAEIQAKEWALTRASVVTELDIPKGLADRINGKDRDGMVEDAKRLMEAFNAEVSKEINKRMATNGGPKPETGAAPRGKLTPAQLEAMTQEDAAAMSPEDFRKNVLGIT